MGRRPAATGEPHRARGASLGAGGEAPRVAGPPTWANPAEALAVCLHRPNRRRIAAIAATVGTALVGINQGSLLASGRLSWLVWVRVGADYLIPTCVSTMGLLAGSRRAGTGPGSDAG